jgi:hypothetical protein
MNNNITPDSAGLPGYRPEDAGSPSSSFLNYRSTALRGPSQPLVTLPQYEPADGSEPFQSVYRDGTGIGMLVAPSIPRALAIDGSAYWSNSTPRLSQHQWAGQTDEPHRQVLPLRQPQPTARASTTSWRPTSSLASSSPSTASHPTNSSVESRLLNQNDSSSTRSTRCRD